MQFKKHLSAGLIVQFIAVFTVFCSNSSAQSFESVFQTSSPATILTADTGSPIAFDEWIRDRLRASTPEGRTRADELSNLFLFSTMALPFIDSALVVGLGQGRWMDALELSAVSAVALSLDALATSSIKSAVGRPRPYMRDCPECGGDGFASFPSGHTSATFTAAGLSCLHHFRFKIYGNEALDASACIVSIAGATATGLLRINADKHYATDVLAGAALGAVSGVLLPWAFYELTGKDSLEPRDEEMHGYRNVILPTYSTVRGLGVGYFARF